VLKLHVRFQAVGNTSMPRSRFFRFGSCYAWKCAL